MKNDTIVKFINSWIEVELKETKTQESIDEIEYACEDDLSISFDDEISYKRPQFKKISNLSSKTDFILINDVDYR
jgi:hypothetical protein